MCAFQVKKFDSIIASMINWISSTTSKITDFNIGSVVRTLLEAVAMELEELYYQLQLATEEAIDEAIYRTFNFPRNPPKKSTGTERFTRMTGTTAVVTIPQGAILATDTEPAVTFETQADDTIESITGIATGGSTTTLVDTTVDFTTLGVIVGARVINLTDGGESVVTSISGTLDDTLNFAALSGAHDFAVGDSYQVVNPYADVPIIATVAGTNGNVAANSIIILQSNIANILSVTNQSAMLNGADEETDTARKTRFALYIQSLARATKGALQYAALTIPQITAALAIDDVRPTVFIYNHTGPVWSDITQAMRNPGDAAIDLFPASERQTDALYIGATELFDYLNMHLVTLGTLTAPGISSPPVWEYWNGAWTALSTGFVDGTNAGTGPLTQSGTVSWTMPTDWVAKIVNGVSRLWIRLRITYNGGDTYTIMPTGDWCSLPPGLGYVNLYCHDGSGDLSGTLKTQVENVVELYRGCGITVNVLAPVKNTPYMTVNVAVAANYDPVEIGVKVNQAIINHLNAKTLGQDLYVAELYQLIMDVDTQAIINADIVYLGATSTASPADILVPSNTVLRANTARITVVAATIT